jgi:hypothetical protein
MHKIGNIKQVRVQRSSLKAGERSDRYYDPSPLLVVSRLLLTARGVVGITTDGKQVIDVHNSDHLASRNRGGNDISLGFTSHYQAMRAQFGLHLINGCAGENILIEAERAYTLDDLGNGVAIQTSTGQFVYLADIEIADPCAPFSQFAARAMLPLSNQRMKETLQFLHNGRRGFYAILAAHQQAMEVQAGNSVFIVERQL